MYKLKDFISIFFENSEKNHILELFL